VLYDAQCGGNLNLAVRCSSTALVARSVSLLRLLTVWGTLWIAASAAAQAEADSAGGASYETTVEEALREYERGRWEEAAALFRRAHQQNPSARTLRGLGLAVYEGRHYPDAIRFLSESLSDTRRPLTQKQREEVTATIERAKLFVGYLKLTVVPESASVTINGQPIHRDASGTTITDTGWLDVELSAPHFKTMLRRVQVNPGDQQSLNVHLESEDEAQVRAEPVPLPAPKAAYEPAPSSETKSSALGTWKWVAGGAAIAGVATGTAFLIAQKVGASSYQKDCVESTQPPDNCADREQLLGSTFWTGAIAGFAVGAAFAAVTVTLFVLDGQPTERPSASVACGAGALGIDCHGRF
jgi:hypothetical protein